ncbi:MAG TPA: glycosyltransferase [Pyrinomonadaceae bacterium]|jgi:glycosyltransferase involved in cell wall biosynthesis|nr:glycosyltransferase [Pyrinomonadaceae bacterium]
MPDRKRISVIVPVRDEAHTIAALLDGLLGQTLPPDEIVITDGGSTDGTRAIVRQFIASGAPVKLLTDDDSLPGRSRNISVTHATNDWIAFIDAGITPAKNWLESLADQVAGHTPAEVVYGSYEPTINSFFTECAAIAYVPPPTITNEGPVRPYSIASALMPRSAWKKAGGFPEHLRSAEDLIFMQRVEAAGFRIVRAPAAVVHWTIQPGLWRTFKRFVVYARNNMRAGLWRNWQRQIGLRYAVLAPLMVPSILFGVRWLVVPIFFWLALMIARALRAIYQNRHSYPAGLMRNLLRLPVIVLILSMIDLATFLGTAQWLLTDWWTDRRDETQQ